MPSSIFIRYLNPWRARREKAEQRIAELRDRDGDRCARCRRPLRFDLPRGHELGPRIEAVRPTTELAAEGMANLCLTHGRCNAPGQDHTGEVLERLRPRREAELFAKGREKKVA